MNSSCIVSPRTLVALLIAGAISAAVFVPVQASAIVPPRDCGILSVSGKRYNIKADQIRCRPARRYSKRYIASHWKPSGYSCRGYRNSALKFRCAKGIHVYYAIRR